MSCPSPLPAASPARPYAAPPDFFCYWTAGGRDAAWIHVDGSLDIATTPDLQLTLQAPLLQTRLVVLDLRAVDFMDSSALHAIVDASLQARAIGRRLHIVRGPPRVDRMFTLTDTTADVEIVDLDPIAPPVQALLELAEAEDEGVRIQPGSAALVNRT
jgi:anti-anti-sigma factor